MKKQLLTIFALLLSFGVYAQKTVVQMQNTQARILEPQSNAYVKPLITELKINEEIGKISDKWELSKDKVEIALGGDLNNIRSYALYLSTKKHKADVIVAALFNVQSNESSTGYEVIVEGFPANYQNWKVADESDLEWIKVENMINKK